MQTIHPDSERLLRIFGWTPWLDMWQHAVHGTHNTTDALALCRAQKEANDEN